MKVLKLPDNDFLLARLETVQDTLIFYLEHNNDEEASLCLNKLREAIFYYNLAFDECPIPEIIQEE